MQFNIEKAIREQIYVKLALIGASGSGKSYSSLRLATGMLNQLKKLGQEGNGKILMANTEASRGRYYASEFDYDIANLAAPYNPEFFVDLINYAIEQNYPVLIIDSSSKEWEGKGGCLEIHQAAGGTYQAWGKVSPRHDRFIETIADSPIHIIATMRSKDQYEVGRDDDGRLNVKKLGVGAKQREGFEYEFTATFLLDQPTNMAKEQKDNTHLFENELEVLLSEEHGRQLIKWANSEEGYTPPVRSRKTEDDIVQELQTEIIQSCIALGGQQNDALIDLLQSKYKTKNPKKIKDIEKLKSLQEELKSIEVIENKE